MSELTRDPLDQAIDRVASRLVSVDHDRAMVERIVTTLPERNGVGGWLRVLVPQAALATVVIAGVLVWTMSHRETVPAEPVAAPRVPEVRAGEVPAARVAVPSMDAAVEAPRMVARRKAAAAPALPVDHERSLAPVDAPRPLEVVSLASPSLPEEAFVVLAPIVLTALPLSGEPNSPR